MFSLNSSLVDRNDAAAISCHSLLKHVQNKTTGMLFRVSEHVLVATDTTTTTDTRVIEVTDFFAICCDNSYHTFVNGKTFAWVENLRHLYSGNMVVMPTSEMICIPANNIVRKGY